MSRYIDADALMAKIDGIIEYIETEIEQAKQCPEKYARTYIPSAVSQLSGIAHAQQEILEAPTAESEIIRCKDCKNLDTTWQNDWATLYHYCPLIDGTRKGDWYCADAERRTDERID